MKQTKIPTIIAILMLVMGLAAGVFLVGNRQIFKLGASAQSAPKNVRITNVDNTGFDVSWTTDKETLGFIIWGDSVPTIDSTVEEDSKVASFVHSVRVADLTANTIYYFKINSDGTEFDNNKIPWQTKTGPKLPLPRESISVSGTVVKQNGSPVDSAIVYINVAGGGPLSGLTSKNGSWVIPLSLARTIALDNFVTIDKSSTTIEVTVQAGKPGTATIIGYPVNLMPGPSVALGKSIDLRNTTVDNSTVPAANLEAPDQSNKQSKFLTLPEDTPTPASSTLVTLDSISSGETIYTNKPEFFGKGLKGTNITIVVDPGSLTASVKVDTLGDWKWTPPSVLSDGDHTIKVTWKEGGIVKTLIREFNVQAASMNPSFVSTPSGTRTPSATPVSTVTPTSTPTSSPEETFAPEMTPIPTKPPIPESGVLTPTLILFMMGLGSLFASGLAVYITINKSNE